MWAAVEAHELGIADLDELEVAADEGGAEGLGLDIGERPADRLGPEGLTFRQTDRVGGDADRHHVTTSG
ncbi:hypothetical protein [Bradyrhizobium retamae]|uniref:hypothetical protein n=1 Tax=Bradyrhizobium retamae TaxID=1300035 RepID=UPI001FD94774|nr:hypothetical protein [Bradyrhizobium retamae]